MITIRNYMIPSIKYLCFVNVLKSAWAVTNYLSTEIEQLKEPEIQTYSMSC